MRRKARRALDDSAPKRDTPHMTDKLALITGATRGLGHALALALAPTHHIMAVGRTTGALEELDDAIKAKGGSATLAPMDVTNADAMATLCRGIFDRWGKLDLWLHTAVHAAPLTPANFMDTKDMSKAIATNVTATSVLIPYVAPLLGEDGTAVFFDDAHAGAKFFGMHGGTKAAQIAMARSWQAETERTGPKVVIASPPPLPTATRARFFPGEDRAKLGDLHDAAAQIIADLN